MRRLAVLPLLVFFASRADAFELLTSDIGFTLFWNRPFDFGADFEVGGDESVASATRWAFDQWGRVLPTRFRPRYVGPVPLDASDGVVTASRLSEWPSDLDPAAVAQTLSEYDVSDGTLYDADVVLNDEHFDFADSGGVEGAFDLKSVLLHEVGHVFGLAHTCGESRRKYPSCFSLPDDPEIKDRVLGAVMAPGWAPEIERRSLGVDDVEGLEFAYPGGPFPRDASKILGIDRACPSGSAVARIEAVTGTIAVELRYASGRVEAVGDFQLQGSELLLSGLAPLDGEGGWDLVLRGERVFATLVDVELASCAPEVEPPAEDASGCDCQSTRSAPQTGMLLWVMLLGLCMRWKRFGASLVLAAAFIAPLTAEAFVCTRVGGSSGPSLIWTDRQIHFAIDSNVTTDIQNPAVVEREIVAGFTEWNAPGCSDIDLVFLGTQSGLAAEFNEKGANINAVVFVKADNGGWDYDPDIIAVTTNAFDTKTGVVLDADIELNDHHFNFTVVDQTCDPKAELMDLRNTVTHEVGHFLGLDHPPDSRSFSETTMFASAPPCETQKQTLEQDDIDGLCSIYPAGQPNNQCFPPELDPVMTDKVGCEAVGTGGSTPLGILFVAGLFLRRRSRR